MLRRTIRSTLPMEQMEIRYRACELGPMPVPEEVFMRARIESNQAIVMAMECGVEISSTYKFPKNKAER